MVTKMWPSHWPQGSRCHSTKPRAFAAAGVSLLALSSVHRTRGGSFPTLLCQNPFRLLFNLGQAWIQAVKYHSI